MAIGERLDVEHQRYIIDEIQRGLANVKAGDIVPHDDAIEEIYAVIDGASRNGEA